MLYQIGALTSERPFALERRLPASRPPSHCRRFRPIPSAHRKVFTKPVRSYCSSAHAGYPQLARNQCRVPVAWLPLLGLGCFSTSHSRSGPLDPSRSKRQAEHQPNSSPYRNVPIVPRSPLPAVLIEPAADQCSGLAFVPPAYCLTNLLEPSSLCSRIDFPSTKK